MDILKPFNHHSREGAPSPSESAHPHLHVMAPVRYPKLSIPSVITLCTGKHAQKLPCPIQQACSSPLYGTGIRPNLLHGSNSDPRPLSSASQPSPPHLQMASSTGPSSPSSPFPSSTAPVSPTTMCKCGSPSSS